jgi:hypothetical protein
MEICAVMFLALLVVAGSAIFRRAASRAGDEAIANRLARYAGRNR